MIILQIYQQRIILPSILLARQSNNHSQYISQSLFIYFLKNQFIVPYKLTQGLIISILLRKRNRKPMIYYPFQGNYIPLSILPFNYFSYVPQRQCSSEIFLTKTSQVQKSTFSPTIISQPHSQECKEQKGEKLSRKSKNKLRNKMGVDDENYRPYVQDKKKDKKKVIIQNRNIIPNIVRLALSFAQRKDRSNMLVEKFLSKSSHGQEWSAKRYYLYQNVVKNKLHSYINAETFSKILKTHPEQYYIYPQEEQIFYNKVARALIVHFLREDSILCLLTSRKMGKDKKQEHFKALRFLLSKMENKGAC